MSTIAVIFTLSFFFFYFLDVMLSSLWHDYSSRPFGNCSFSCCFCYVFVQSLFLSRKKAESFPPSHIGLCSLSLIEG